MNPNTAKLFLKVWFVLALVWSVFITLISVLGSLALILIQSLAPNLSDEVKSMQQHFASDLKVQLDSNTRLDISEVSLAAPIQLLDFLPMLFLLALTGFVMFKLFRSLSAFLDRVFNDPFHASNAGDLAKAARWALLWQGLSLLSSLDWVRTSYNPTQVERVREALVGAGLEVERTGALPWMGLEMLDFTPLALAAALALLSHIFRRVHELHLDQQRLKTEQELTI